MFYGIMPYSNTNRRADKVKHETLMRQLIDTYSNEVFALIEVLDVKGWDIDKEAQLDNSALMKQFIGTYGQEIAALIEEFGLQDAGIGFHEGLPGGLCVDPTVMWE